MPFLLTNFLCACAAGEGSAANQHLGGPTSNERHTALPFGGRMRSKRGIRRKRLADLSTPVLSAKEVEWFVELQSKHKKGHSTNWAAMLNEWNTTLVQLSLDPRRLHLCQGVMPKSMGQLQKFEKVAFDAINTCNSITSAFARQSQGVSSGPIPTTSTAPTLMAHSTPHPPCVPSHLQQPHTFKPLFSIQRPSSSSKSQVGCMSHVRLQRAPIGAG